jgi:mannose-6-phosphate isomerase-like protein (cupin superfamily)
MVISKGQVTMVYGGTVVDGKTTAPGETRGPAIKGGTEVKLGPGDILHIPARVPHQMKLDPGAQVTYFVTKVVQ